MFFDITYKEVDDLAEICIDDSVYTCPRGIYGIFIIKDDSEVCAYVGKSEQVQCRVETHKAYIENGSHAVDSLNKAYNDSNAKIKITVLEKVPYEFDNYYKDAQRLASAENRWIDKYQEENQCLEQVPEGKRPSKEKWEMMKTRRCNMAVVKLTLNQEHYDIIKDAAEEKGITMQDYIRNKIFGDQDSIFIPPEAVTRAFEKYELNDRFTLPEIYGESWNIARGFAGVFGKQFFEYVEHKYPGMIKYVGQVDCGRHAQYQIISVSRTDL